MPRISGAIPTPASTPCWRSARSTICSRTTRYYPRPGELEALLLAAGLEPVDAVSLKSIAHRLEAELARVAAPIRDELDRLAQGLSREPEVLATCGHAVLVARRSR